MRKLVFLFVLFATFGVVASGGCDVQGFCSGSCCYGRNFQIVVHGECGR